MPVKIIIRENGKQCMMQMPVKTTLRLYCDDSRLVFKCIQRHQCIATQLPCYYSFVHKNVIVKLREICMETGSTSSATKVIARYTRERGSPEANSGLSTSNLLLSPIILSWNGDISAWVYDFMNHVHIQYTHQPYHKPLPIIDYDEAIKKIVFSVETF